METFDDLSGKQIAGIVILCLVGCQAMLIPFACRRWWQRSGLSPLSDNTERISYPDCCNAAVVIVPLDTIVAGTMGLLLAGLLFFLVVDVMAVAFGATFGAMGVAIGSGVLTNRFISGRGRSTAWTSESDKVGLLGTIRTRAEIEEIFTTARTSSPVALVRWEAGLREPTTMVSYSVLRSRGEIEVSGPDSTASVSMTGSDEEILGRSKITQVVISMKSTIDGIAETEEPRKLLEAQLNHRFGDGSSTHVWARIPKPDTPKVIDVYDTDDKLSMERPVLETNDDGAERATVSFLGKGESAPLGSCCCGLCIFKPFFACGLLPLCVCLYYASAPFHMILTSIDTQISIDSAITARIARDAKQISNQVCKKHLEKKLAFFERVRTQGGDGRSIEALENATNYARRLAGQ